MAATEDGSSATIEVLDNGSGMNDEVLQHVYEPFFTTRTDQNGSGMGLPVIHGIVSDYGGSIDISSEVSNGTRIIVTLPASGGFWAHRWQLV